MEDSEHGEKMIMGNALDEAAAKARAMLNGEPETMSFYDGVPQVMPGVLPTNISFAVREGKEMKEDGNVVPVRMIQVYVSTPAGIMTTFFNADDLERVQRQMTGVIAQARSGLQIAG